MRLSAPVPLAPEHDTSSFACQHASLSEWLKKRALTNQTMGASRTFVLCAGQRVAGFYSLAAASIEHRQATSGLRRNMPDPIPAVLLARLAVDLAFQNRGLGSDLLRDALLRSLHAAADIGARAMLCHAIDEPARSFYTRHGLRPSPVEPMTMLLDMNKVRELLQETPEPHRSS